MFEITDSAAKQFIASLESAGDGKLSLRVSARKSAQRGMIYNMGLDTPRPDDMVLQINGINVVVDPDSVTNVQEMIIDFREFEGQEQFVFVNPNDIKEECSTSPSGCDPDGNPSCKSCQEEQIH